MEKITFNYAFGEPHRITLSRPSASEKRLVTTCRDHVEVKWAWGNLKDKFPLSWVVMPMDVKLELSVYIDGVKAEFLSWRRTESGAPALVAEGKAGSVAFALYAIAAKGGDVFKLTVSNNDQRAHQVNVVLQHLNGWVVSNRGWVDGKNWDVLMTMNDGRADRLIAMASGADCYSDGEAKEALHSGVPMANAEYGGGKVNLAKALSLTFKLEAGQTKQGHLYLPYERYFEDAETIRGCDFDALIKDAEREWENLLDRSAEVIIGDQGIIHCFKSCLADLFVMREELAGGFTGVSCGTEQYRSVNPAEPMIAALALDQFGYTQEAESDMRVFLGGQDENGCWTYSKGWEHEMWGSCYFKASVALEHYRLSGNTKFLLNVYERMKRSSLFNHAARNKSKTDKESFSYGLMPRGMGDCGLRNGADFYGVFYPWNCLSVAADKITLEAAKILNKTEDFPLLTEIYETAKADLITSLRRNYRELEGKAYIPGTATADNSSFYGCLFAFYPADLLPADDPLIAGMTQIIKSNTSAGGLPMGTGWLKDGLWVAMALDNIASAYLRMGQYDEASRYLYPVFNHATPLVTWCEERGAEPGSDRTSGDLQHLWTPVAICRFLRDSMVMESSDRLHIAAASVREWLSAGEKIGVKNFRTHFGALNFSIERKKENNTIAVALDAERSIDSDVEIHIRLPLHEYSLKVTASNCHVIEVKKESVIVRMKDNTCHVTLSF